MWAAVVDALTASVNHEMCSIMYRPLDCSLVWRAVCPTGYRSGLSWNINQLVAVIIAAFDGPGSMNQTLLRRDRRQLRDDTAIQIRRSGGQAEVAGH